MRPLNLNAMYGFNFFAELVVLQCIWLQFALIALLLTECVSIPYMHWSSTTIPGV